MKIERRKMGLKREGWLYLDDIIIIVVIIIEFMRIITVTFLSPRGVILQAASLLTSFGFT